MSVISGAEAILKSLVQEGVTTIFGYPGGAIMPLYDAMYDYTDDIKHILVRHEQGAIHAAQGYARATGKIGVCIATSGPGATNLITGMADANIDSTPIICITGQVTSALLGTDAFQEVDIIGISLPVTKWNYQIRSVYEIPHIMAKAFHIAQTGRPGVVLIDITKDAQLAKCNYTYQKFDQNKTIIPIAQDIIQAAHLINNARKPYILAGQGVLIANAEQELAKLASKANIPVACTLLGLSAISAANPLFVGMLGMHGNYGCNILTNEADVIIAIGMRFDDRVTGNLEFYAKQALIIHIDIDTSEIGKNIAVKVKLQGNAQTILKSLIKFIEPSTHTEWLSSFNKYMKIEQETVIDKETINCSGSIKMAEVVTILSDKTAGKAIVVTDVGQNQMIVARYYKFSESRCHITSGGAGTMGFSLPAAIGAKIGLVDKEVVSISGDGGFQMNIQELGVIMQEKIALKIIILNNNYLGMVRQWQELYFDSRYSCTKLLNPDFIKLAQSYDIKALQIKDRQFLAAGLDEMLNSNEAFLLEILVENQENIFPMVGPNESVSEMKLCR